MNRDCCQESKRDISKVEMIVFVVWCFVFILFVLIFCISDDLRCLILIEIFQNVNINHVFDCDVDDKMFFDNFSHFISDFAVFDSFSWLCWILLCKDNFWKHASLCKDTVQKFVFNYFHLHRYYLDHFHHFFCFDHLSDIFLRCFLQHRCICMITSILLIFYECFVCISICASDFEKIQILFSCLMLSHSIFAKSWRSLFVCAQKLMNK